MKSGAARQQTGVSGPGRHPVSRRAVTGPQCWCRHSQPTSPGCTALPGGRAAAPPQRSRTHTAVPAAAAGPGTRNPHRLARRRAPASRPLLSVTATVPIRHRALCWRAERRTPATARSDALSEAAGTIAVQPEQRRRGHQPGGAIPCWSRRKLEDTPTAAPPPAFPSRSRVTFAVRRPGWALSAATPWCRQGPRVGAALRWRA
jgi:hypothetical protein